jgi:hypothetical protein
VSSADASKSSPSANCYSLASSNLHTAFVRNQTAAVLGMYVS